MIFSEINPYIRFAQSIRYRGTGENVLVRDCRLFYVTEGSGVIRLGEKQYRLLPGTLFYCAAAGRYAITAESICLTVLNFDLTQQNRMQTETLSPIPLREPDALPTVRRDTVEDCPWLNGHLCLSRADSLPAALSRILEEFSLRRVGYREAAGGILKTALTEMHRASLSDSDSAADTVTRLMTYIRQHIGEDLRGRTLSALSGYHEVHLNRLFSRHAGMTVHRYVLSVRVDAARQLLLNSDLSLSEIAEQTGFSSAAHLGGCFREYTGISPARFRREAGK